MISFKQFLTELRAKPKALTDFIKEKITQGIFSDSINDTMARWKLRHMGSGSQMLKDLNFATVGKGAYAVVIGNQTYPYVIKVFDDNDKGYQAWLSYMIQNQSNPYVPKIRGRPTKIRGSGHSFIRLEKLREMDSQEELDFKRQLYSGNNKHLNDILDFINNRSGQKNDLHAANAMVRPNGSYVVTDPLI